MDDHPVTAPLPRVGAGFEEVALMIGVGRTLLIQADKTGEFGPQFRKLGGRKIACVAEVAAWMAAGMPPRLRWVEMWPGIASQTQESVENGACGVVGRTAKGHSVYGGERQ